MQTTHPTNGELRTFLDDESGEDENRAVRAHLETCDRCRRAAEELRTREEEVRRLLSRIDPPARTDAALRRVEERLDAARRRPRFAVARMSLAKAALLVLFLGAGVGAAIPGSPVRDWLGAAWSAVTGVPGGPEAASRAPTATAPEASTEPTPAGVRVSPAGGRVRIELVDAPSGAPVLVRVADRPDAGVSAPAGARFSSAEGRIRAHLAGAGSGGAVEVELPRDVPAAEVVVNGRLHLRLREGTIELPGPEPLRSEDGTYRFSAPAPSGGGDPEP